MRDAFLSGIRLARSRPAAAVLVCGQAVPQEAMMMVPQDNADFVCRPADAVAALFPDRGCVRAAVTSLHDAGFAPLAVRPEHPGRCRLQDWGGDATIMNLYVEGLRKGHTLLVVPASRDRREAVGRLLVRHQCHAVYYFTRDAVESLTVLV